MPAGSCHSASPSSTPSMPGLLASSRCSAWVSGAMKSKPERRSACRGLAADRQGHAQQQERSADRARIR